MNIEKAREIIWNALKAWRDGIASPSDALDAMEEVAYQEPKFRDMIEGAKDIIHSSL